MLDTLKDFWDDYEGLLLPATIGVIIVMLMGVLIYFVAVSDAHDAAQWEQFRVAHNCRMTSQIKGKATVGYGTTSNGKSGIIVIQEPDKTTWLCDDGVSYTR